MPGAGPSAAPLVASAVALADEVRNTGTGPLIPATDVRRRPQLPSDRLEPGGEVT